MQEDLFFIGALVALCIFFAIAVHIETEGSATMMPVMELPRS